MSKAGKRGKSAQGGGGAKWETALLAATFEEVISKSYFLKNS